MKRTILMAMLTLSSAACMHKRSSQEMAAKNPWIGRSLEELVTAEGYPIRKHTSPKGNEVYEYRTSVRRPATTDGRVTFSSLYREEDTVVTQECVQWFEIQERKILNVQTKNCD